MPHSKRAKVVSLTKVKAKTREDKEKLITRIRDCLELYKDVYTFQISNIRTNILQQIREERSGDSRLFLGNNRLMALAIGRDKENSQRPELFQLSPFLTGHCGLLMTNLPKKEVKAYFAGVCEEVYARTGQPASQTCVLPPGPLPQFPHSMFDHLHKLGLPIRLDKGVITLDQEVTVCEEGDTLSAEAAQILRLLDIKLAAFSIELTAHWSDGKAKRMGGGGSTASS